MGYELSRIDQQASAGTFTKPMFTEVADLLSKHCELHGVIGAATRLVLNDFGLDVAWRIIKLD